MSTNFEIALPNKSKAAILEQYYHAVVGVGKLATNLDVAREQAIDILEEPYTKFGIKLGRLQGTFCPASTKLRYGSGSHPRIGVYAETPYGPTELELCNYDGVANFELQDLAENRHLAFQEVTPQTNTDSSTIRQGC